MSNDPRVHWELANPYGILVNEPADSWWSGHVSDMLEIDGGLVGLLVATDTGGVWWVDPANHAIPLSNTWDDPDINCLAVGPFGSRHFFAGCNTGTIYETNILAGAPLFDWQTVVQPLPQQPLLGPDGRPSGPVAGKVYDIAIIYQHRLIIAACSGGLFWSNIPPQSGSTRPPFVWTRATMKDPSVDPGGFYSVTVGSLAGREIGIGEEQSLLNISIIAGGLKGGVYVGHWSIGSPNTLELTRGTLADGTFDAAGGPSSVAACKNSPRYVYAVCAEAGDDGFLKMIVRSDDGGQTWRQTNYNIKKGIPGADLRTIVGKQGGYNNCIAVLPDGPGIVAVGWAYAVLISPDMGSSWYGISGQAESPEKWTLTNGDLHVDNHALLFKVEPLPPPSAGKHDLYIGSDGGLAQISVDQVFSLAGPLNVRTDFNSRLATLQVYSNLIVGADTTPGKERTFARDFYGSMSVSPAGRGWVSAGLQDNGTVFSNLLTAIPPAGPPTPWIQCQGGDGGWNALLFDGGMVANAEGTAVTSFEQPGFVVSGVPPIVVPDPFDKNGLVPTSADVVRHPSFRNRFGEKMFAAAGTVGNISKASEVYGLFQSGPEQSYHWERLGTTPQGWRVDAVGSYNGGTVMVATANADHTQTHLFALDSKAGSFLDLPIILPTPIPDTPQTGGVITRIVMVRDGIGFAVLNGTNLKNNYLLRLDGLHWIVPMATGLPSKSSFFGLEAIQDRDRIILFVTTDDQVYMSEDAGNTWVQASGGLPARAHCGDLRAGKVDGRSFLFLGTYGRSVWQTNLQGMNIG